MIPDVLRRHVLAGLVALMLSGTAWAQAPDRPCAAAAQHIPERPAAARVGSAFAQAVAPLSEPERDEAIRGELLSGNLPPFLRQVLPATLNASLPDGRAVQLTLCVLSDYLALGSDSDFLLVPMGLDTALAVAGRFGFVLPTRRMVDLIYRQAAVRLRPQPLPASDGMRSTAYYLRHHAMVQAQRSSLGGNHGALTAGHKKDLVLSARLWTEPGRVAIYGWHRAVDAPIQTLSTVHGARYADYSHGVRLVSSVVFVNGVARSMAEVLADGLLAPLLSDEGPLPPPPAAGPGRAEPSGPGRRSTR
jgi:hypothetical protein